MDKSEKQMKRIADSLDKLVDLKKQELRYITGQTRRKKSADIETETFNEVGEVVSRKTN
ncbi:hypothetical protein [Salicibibacter kimchii]|uniref:hypothetical protein n=1 Tax=Salicibibacter kimchii TaxID=2099786 RepID=UPI00135739BB|nr:hypothetical protein [Salicibibacter kimchii]